MASLQTYTFPVTPTGLLDITVPGLMSESVELSTERIMLGSSVDSFKIVRDGYEILFAEGLVRSIIML